MHTDIKITEKDDEFIISITFQGTRVISFVHSLNRPVRYEDLHFVIETIIDSVRDATERDVEYSLHQLVKRRECRDCGEFKHRSEGRYIENEFICKQCDKWYTENFGDA